jgi:hypothetical protein
VLAVGVRASHVLHFLGSASVVALVVAWVFCAGLPVLVIGGPAVVVWPVAWLWVASRRVACRCSRCGAVVVEVADPVAPALFVVLAVPIVAAIVVVGLALVGSFSLVR